MDYDQFRIKRFDCWDLYLHVNQYPYVGRCYAWAIRPEADKISDMNVVERDELFSLIIPSWEKAVQQLYSPDRTNLAILGNETPHLHAHIIPRYSTPRNYYEIEFVDPNPKGNYVPYEKKKIDLNLLLLIKEGIKLKI